MVVKPGDVVRYTAAWLRSGNVHPKQVHSMAGKVGTVVDIFDSGTLTAVEVQFRPRRPSELVNPAVLEVVQEHS